MGVRLKVIEQLIRYLRARELLTPDQLAYLRDNGFYAPPEDDDGAGAATGLPDIAVAPRRAPPQRPPYDEYADAEEVERAIERRRPGLTRRKWRTPYRKRARR
jgi:hypothetical protein